MTRLQLRERWRAAGVRVRLGVALGVALLPVLVLSGVQSALVFQRDATEKRADLVDAASRGAASANARIAQSQELLRGLGASTSGYECVTRLADIKSRLRDYSNIIRFNADGWVTCSAAPAPVDPDRASQPWFHALAAGQAATTTSEPEPDYAPNPALLASVRVEHGDGQFAGVLTAVVTLVSLLPQRTELSMPRDAKVALADTGGRFISTSVPGVFPTDLGGRLSAVNGGSGRVWLATDRDGEVRLFTASPVVARDVYLVLSAPSEGILSWARLNPVSALMLPMLAFALALIAVAWVAERGVVRWIVYLRRIAALYARGRYSVRPLRAAAAPPEIRELADALGAMATTISARDAALRESLAAKDDLMREIHHRVKNNLQVISSLLNLQQRVTLEPAATAALNETRHRIIAIGLIYRALYEGPNLKVIDLHAFLSELIGQLLIDRMGRAHSMQTELCIDSLVVDPDRLAPLALFIVEAITSVCSRKFPGGQGFISVAFHMRDGQAELTVSDNGRRPNAEDSGHSMMALFARQLGGLVSDTIDVQGWIALRLTFPIGIESPRPVLS